MNVKKIARAYRVTNGFAPDVALFVFSDDEKTVGMLRDVISACTKEAINCVVYAFEPTDSSRRILRALRDAGTDVTMLVGPLHPELTDELVAEGVPEETLAPRYREDDTRSVRKVIEEIALCLDCQMALCRS